MKLSEVTPCTNCGGMLRSPFYVLQVAVAIASPRAFDEVMGLTRYFNGHLGLAEVMTPDPEVIKVMPDEASAQMLLCDKCYMLPALRLAELCDRANTKTADAEERAALPASAVRPLSAAGESSWEN